jgi:hypothetical protein
LDNEKRSSFDEDQVVDLKDMSASGILETAVTQGSALQDTADGKRLYVKLDQTVVAIKFDFVQITKG